MTEPLFNLSLTVACFSDFTFLLPSLVNQDVQVKSNESMHKQYAKVNAEKTLKSGPECF